MLGSFTALLILLIFIGTGIRLAPSGYSDSLSMDNTIRIRGIASIIVVVHHFSGWFSNTNFLTPFQHVGFLGVALFLFLSGYGLMYSASQKENYLNDFWKKRLPSLLIPYYIINLAYIVVDIVMTKDIDFRRILLSSVGLSLYIGAAWYIIELIMLYILFYIAFKSKNPKMVFITGFIILYATLILASGNGVYTRSLVAFPLGMYWYKNRSKIDKYISEKWTAKMFFTTATLIIGLGIKLISAYLNSEILLCSGNILSSFVFCIWVCLLMNRFTLVGKLWGYIGKISMEIYLVHLLVLEVLGKTNIRNSILLFFVLAIFLTVILAHLFHEINSCILGKLKK